MKKIIYLIFLLLPVLSIQSCLSEEEDIFDGTATERVAKATQEYNKVLVDSEHGWAFDFYTQKNQAAGGITLLCKFHENGTVDVASMNATNVPARQVVTSEYSMNGTQGPVLSFSEYNGVMHYYSEPSTSNVEGREIADYEFVMYDVSPNEVTLKGKKWGNYMTMTRLESSDWDAYFDKIPGNSVINNPIVGVALTVGGKTYSGVLTSRSILRLSLDGGNTETIAFNITDKGLNFCRALSINGVKIKHFTVDTATDTYTCTDAGVNAKMVCLPYNNDFLNGTSRYRIGLDKCSTGVKQTLEGVKAASPGGRVIGTMYMGNSTITGYNFCSFTFPYVSGTSNFNSIFRLVAETVDGTTDEINFVSWTDVGGLNTSNFKSLLTPFFNDLVSKSPFALTTDIEWVIITSKADPDFVIAVSN